MRPPYLLRALPVLLLVCAGKCCGMQASLCIGSGAGFSLSFKCADPLVIFIADITYGVDDADLCKQECCVTLPPPQCTEVSYNSAVAACAGRSTCIVTALQIAAVQLMTCSNATATFLQVTYNCTPATTPAASLVSSSVPIVPSSSLAMPGSSSSSAVRGSSTAGAPADMQGLSTAAKIGIGVGAGCTFVLLVVLITLLLLRHRKRRLVRKTGEDDDHGFVDDSSRWDDAQSRIKKRNDSLLKHAAANKRPAKKGRTGDKKSSHVASSSSHSQAGGSQAAPSLTEASTDQKPVKSSNQIKIDSSRDELQQQTNRLQPKVPVESANSASSLVEPTKTIKSSSKQPRQGHGSSSSDSRRVSKEGESHQVSKSGERSSTTSAARDKKPANPTPQKRESSEIAQSSSSNPMTDGSKNGLPTGSYSGGQQVKTSNEAGKIPLRNTGGDTVREVEPLSYLDTSSNNARSETTPKAPSSARQASRDEAPAVAPRRPSSEAPKPAARTSRGIETSID